MHLFFFFAPLAEHPCRLLVPVRLWCTALAMGQEQPRGLEPSAVPLGGSAWRKKIPKKHPNPYLIPSNGSLSPDLIRKLPSHEPLQVCFGQEVRSDGFILDVLTLSNANNYYCRPRTDPIGKMHQGSGEHPWVDGGNCFAVVSSFTF